MVNLGHNVGRVNIRVLPDTTGFLRDLKRKLETLRRETSMKVRVTGADLDRARIREDIERQLATMKGLDLNAKVAVTVDRAKLARKKLRASIQAQFDQFEDIRVKIAAEVANHEEFQRQVKRLVREASRNKATIDVDAKSLGFKTHMATLTRPRSVAIFVKLNKASVAKVTATLAALSGARLAFKWIDDLKNMVRDLDKNLPMILTWTTGIGSLVGGLAGATSGIVGIGQGFIKMLPGLLVVPGLLLNAAGSVTALVVALKNVKTELKPLSGDMHDLGDIINDTFWKRARKPIISLVKDLMPQLKRAFHDLASGIGDFTKAMSNAFGKELAGGRLEGIFKGIADGWRILGTGADGFAGALVNLSQIASKYTPRLATWLVRQANTFDKWLDRITTNGQLDDMMQGAIDSVYDLWDALRGISGVFSGIWKAADKAGSKGLSGFADMMLDWKKIVNSTDFQKGLVAIFTGAHDAMGAFGDAVKAIGQLVGDLNKPIERFIGASGGFIGGMVENIAKALDNPHVAKGLDSFSDSLGRIVDKIKPSLQPLADTFGDFLGLLGDLGETILPTAFGILADLAPAMQDLIDNVKPVLKPLGEAIGKVSDILAPAIDDFVKKVSPAAAQALVDIAGVLPGMAKSLAGFISLLAPVVGPLVTALGKIIGGTGKVLGQSPLGVVPHILDGDTKGAIKETKNILKGGGFWGFILNSMVKISKWAFDFVRKVQSVTAAVKEEWGKIITWFNTRPAAIGKALASAVSVMNKKGREIVDGLVKGAKAVWGAVIRWFSTRPEAIRNALGDATKFLLAKGKGVINGLKNGLKDGWKTAAAWIHSRPDAIRKALGDATKFLLAKGKGVINGLKNGVHYQWHVIVTWFRSRPGAIRSALGGTTRILLAKGRGIINGLRNGVRDAWTAIVTWFRTRPAAIRSALGNLKNTLWNAGWSIISGFYEGITSGITRVYNFVSGIASTIASLKGPESYDRQLLVANGEWIMSGLQKGLERGFGRVQSRVATFADGIRDQLGAGLGSDIATGLANGMNTATQNAGSLTRVGQQFVGRAGVTDRASVQVIQKGNQYYSYDPTDVARKQAQMMTRALDAVNVRG